MSRKTILYLNPYEYTGYEFEKQDGKLVEVEKTYTVDVRKELSTLLRGNGVCKSGPEIVEAVTVARMIRDCENDAIELAEEDMEMIRRILNVYISQENNPAAGKFSLGGPRYEELIFRVFSG